MLVSRKHKALILRLKDPERVLAVLPKAKKFTVKGKEFLAVPHRRDEVKVLANLGIEAPSPMLYYYDWPGRFKPFDAQRQAGAFMAQHNRAFNLSEMGTGKTLATLWAYDYLRSIGGVKKVLVVTPLSTLERTWADEVFQHFPHLTTSVLYGSGEKRLKMLDLDADLYLINHDGLKVHGLIDAINAREDIDLVIVDEIAQVARTFGADRYKALMAVVRRLKLGPNGNLQKTNLPERMAWGLTGTPTPNQPTDAWAQCRLLVPERVPPYFKAFRDNVMRQVSTYTWVNRDNAAEIVKESMQPAIRFSRDECMDMPPCLYETRQVEMTPAQRTAYKDMLNKLCTELEGGQILAVNEAVKAQKLIQIAAGAVYGDHREVSIIDPGPRLAVVQEIVEEASGKVIVFVPFVSMVELVSEYLIKQGITVECIHGGVSKGERDRIFSAFQKTKEPRVLVAQPAAMSHGLTLTAANTVVWYAPITSNETFEQANARVTRPGQTRGQLIVMVEGSPVERKYFNRLKDKSSTQGVLLEMIRAERQEMKMV